MILMTGFHWYFGVVQASAGAAALSLSVADDGGQTSGTIESAAPSAAGTINIALADQGITINATASGGAGGYSYAWTNTELSDATDGGGPANNFSINNNGTTNAVSYDGLVLDCDVSGGSSGEVFTARYRIRCTVTDSASATATADYTLDVNVNIE